MTFTDAYGLSEAAYDATTDAAQSTLGTPHVAVVFTNPETRIVHTLTLDTLPAAHRLADIIRTHRPHADIYVIGADIHDTE